MDAFSVALSKCQCTLEHVIGISSPFNHLVKSPETYHDPPPVRGRPWVEIPAWVRFVTSVGKPPVEIEISIEYDVTRHRYNVVNIRAPEGLPARARREV